jgi:hypothetical protein
MESYLLDSTSYPDLSSIAASDGNKTSVIDIRYTRPATIFAAVCAILFTIVGIAGRS